MTLKELIKNALRQAAEDTEMPLERKVALLIGILTEYLSKKDK